MSQLSKFPRLGWSWISTSSTDRLLKSWLYTLASQLDVFAWVFKSRSAWERLRNWQMPQEEIVAAFQTMLSIACSSLLCFGTVVCVSPAWWNSSEPQSTNLCLEMMVQISNTSKGKANHQSGFTLVRPSFLSHLCNWTPDYLGCPLMPSRMLPNFKKMSLIQLL